jgi:RNA polymerase primary sigma factor
MASFGDKESFFDIASKVAQTFKDCNTVPFEKLLDVIPDEIVEDENAMEQLLKILEDQFGIKLEVACHESSALLNVESNELESLDKYELPLVKMYFSENNNADLLTRAEEQALTTAIESLRRTFQEHVLNNYYVLESVLDILKKIHSKSLSFDRTLRLSTFSTNKDKLVEELEPTIKKVEKSLKTMQKLFMQINNSNVSERKISAFWRMINQKLTECREVMKNYPLYPQRYYYMILKVEQMAERLELLQQKIKEFEKRKCYDSGYLEMKNEEHSLKLMLLSNNPQEILNFTNKAKDIYEEYNSAKKKMASHNFRLVIYICKKYYRPGINFLDLIQEGIVGLMKAIEKYEPSSGFKFSTYATWWIRQAVTRAVSEGNRIIRIPQHILDLGNKVRNIVNKFKETKLREPTMNELSEMLNLPLEEVKRIYNAYNNTVSLDRFINNHDDNTFSDFLVENDNYQPDNILYNDTLKEKVQQVLKTLNYRERELLKMRYGLEDNYAYTLDEIGKLLKITRERVRQLEAKAIMKLQHPLRLRQLQDL